MSGPSLFSDSWYRVSELKPRLRKHVEIHRRDYRGRRWYVLQDRITGKFHRFSPDAYFVIQMMDGTRTVHEIWMAASRCLDSDHLPTQDDIIHLLSRLHQADVLLGGTKPDSEEMTERQEKIRKKQLVGYFANPLGMRFPLLDPERWLQHLRGLAGFMFHPLTALVWALLLASATTLAMKHWDALSQNVADRVLSGENLVLLWFIYPVVKFFHEMGHALAVKRWGGEVHEMGIMLMVLVPIPYVDASEAHAFRHKYQRVMVGCAGVAVELFIASLAMWFWAYAEEGLSRAIAYNVILVASVSTLVFNLNPLLRYDGYHVLADLIEVPNLGQRANQYLGYLIKHYIFSVRDAESPVSVPSERYWFMLYSVASFCYRMFILYVIVLFVSGKYFIVGVLLAFWSVLMMIFVPAFRVLKTAWTDPRLEEHRSRGMGICAAAILGVILILTLVPIPSATLAEGLVWVPENMWVRAGSDGFVSRVVASENARVHKGDVLIRCTDPELMARMQVARARMTELTVRYTKAIDDDRVQAKLLQKEIERTRAEEDYLQQRIAALSIRSPVDGRFLIRDPENLTGQYVHRGEKLAYVVQPGGVLVRAAVMQENVKQVRENTVDVQVRLRERFGHVYDSRILREVPAAIHTLPSLALSVQGGGHIALDPKSRKKPRAFKSLFQFDVAMPKGVHPEMMGSRVYVRFVHSDEPLAWQWYRHLRQTFLSVLHV